MESFGRDLIESGFATSDSIIGCDSAEIAQVYSLAPEGFPIPDEYHAFLAQMGKQAGTLFRGTDLFFPRMLDAREAAEDISGEGPTLENHYFFGHHQGYKVYFFRSSSPRFMSSDGSGPAPDHSDAGPQAKSTAMSYFSCTRQHYFCAALNSRRRRCRIGSV